ncbi:hypothetical protein GRF29_106g902064 [Pseudopithomyces chartarum]|uniref:Cytochrome P450 n=1 Tax=Pseudopithomyces chartarum TaxID=1892770 RepID=A0AAN6LX43_9PLEO|nr:hypothetical protein GRF29_106g902064 [Pseudopithomyces chartarum]
MILSNISLLGAIAAGCLLYYVGTIIYNVFFHPLAKFPGPWWAGASSYAEAYFDIVKGGRYFKKVEAMHARYDARREIDTSLARLSGAPTSVISTVEHDHHKVRRMPLLPFFSKQSIAKLEPFIWSRVNLLVAKLRQALHTGETVELIDGYGAITTDVISRYAYGESFDYLGKDSDMSFKNDYLHAINVILGLPQWALQFMHPGFTAANDLRRWCTENALKALQATQSGIETPSTKPKTIFETLLGPDMPPEEKTLERMTDESFLIVGAGLETTSRFLTNTTTHLLLNPDCLSKLRAELKVAMPTPDYCPPCSVLENLPYLSAVVAEGLRCETILVNRFSRKILEPLPYKGFVIPAGVFPEPEKFRPERWIEAREQGINLNKYLATFVKGGRMCLGINLAYTELYLTLAAIFRNFDMELVDSGLENITSTRGFTFGFTDSYDWGVKIRLIKALE